MVTLVLTALGLGLAGLDPAGALIGVAALAAGARPGMVLAYGLLVLLGTPLWGTLLSLTVGQQLAGIDWGGLVPSDPVVVVLESVAGVGALVWAGLRLARDRGETSPRRPRKPRAGAGLLAVGSLFALGAALDPTFVGLVVIAGRGDPWWTVAVAHLIWALVSQAPLAVLLIAVVRGAHVRVAAVTERWWRRVRPTVRVVLTVVLALAGVVLLLDVGWFLATGGFLVPGP